MDTDNLSSKQQAIEQLQQLGLKEYEARAFVALARLPSGTAKDISEIAEVPRTRVYDAVRVLETKGLVEIQHSSPQVFRAVSIEEAVETLLAEYQSRTEQLEDALQGLETAEQETDQETVHEIWALSGHRAIVNRTQQLLDEANRELALVIGEESVLTDRLIDRLQAAQQRGVTVFVGTTEDSVRERIQTQVPGASVFVSGLGWVHGSEDDETQISRLLLIDGETILVSSSYDAGAERHEQAVFGRGFENGVVTIVRRLISAGADLDASASAPEP
jgi:sugar-specific transcriptional regulator TrmB